MKARFNIDVRNNSEVVGIDTNKKTATVNSKRIFTLRNIPDTDNIKSYVDKKGIDSAVVVGGGYIGVEIILNDGVKAFKNYECSVEVTLNSGKKISTDIVILAIGVIPDTGFVKEAGIKQGRIAADNIAGLNTTYKGTQGTSIIKVFGLIVANKGAQSCSFISLDFQ